MRASTPRTPAHHVLTPLVEPGVVVTPRAAAGPVSASAGTGVTTPAGTFAAAAGVAGLARTAAGLGAANCTLGADLLRGAAVVVGWATGFGRADTGPPLACRKSSVTNRVPPLTITPMPTWLKPPSRMFSRWWGLFMKASWTAPTDPPMPTFSPMELALRPLRLALDTKLPCQMLPFCAISALWATAIDATSLRHPKAGRPAAARA